MSRSTIIAPSGRPARFELALNRYQATSPGSYRSTIPGTLQDANKDASRSTRRELARQAWHWYQNSPFIAGIIERLVTYTVGTGINPMPATTDKGWNKAALDVWEGLAEQVEYRQGLPWAAYLGMAFRDMLVCGDMLTTYSASGRPRLVSFESHDITSKQMTGASEYLDGVTVDASGRVVGYELSGGVRVAAVNAVLHWIPQRPKQYRGVSILAPALYHIHDLQDILALEKQAVKHTSSQIDVIKTAGGELDTEDLIVSGGTVNPVDGENRVEWYRQNFGAETRVLKTGDEYVPLVPNRPSPAWQGFVQYLAQSICLATGIPPSVIIPVSGTGVDVRRDLATAQRVVEVWQGMLTAQLKRIRTHLIDFEIQDGGLSPAPPDWQRVLWQLPRAITVDSGRDAKADIEMVKLGLMTRQEFHGQYGQNPDEQDAQVIREAQERKQSLSDAELTLTEFASLMAPQAQQIVQQNPAEQPEPKEDEQ